MGKFDGLLSAKERIEVRETPKSPVKVVPAPKNAKSRAIGKRSDPDYTQITAYIKKETHENVMRKIYKRQELSELLEELLADWMKTAK